MSAAEFVAPFRRGVHDHAEAAQVLQLRVRQQPFDWRWAQLRQEQFPFANPHRPRGCQKRSTPAS